MRAALGLACLFTLIGCASPQPVARSEEDQRAERLINYSAESGEPINTSDGKKIVCKQEQVTNTRLKNKKVCMTPEQWQARTNTARDGVQEAMKTGEVLPPRGN